MVDRPIAIKGLEERLVKTFATKGGFGIFASYLERSLLWQRPLGGSLTPITFPPGRNVPSWSWMAYKGPISYVQAPFDLVDWTRDYVSPFSTLSGLKQHWEVNNGGPSSFRGTARKLFMDTEEATEKIRFDQSNDYAIQDLRCIVIGKDKPDTPKGYVEHYVLVIMAFPSDDTERFVRVGVGKLLAGHILQDEEVQVEVR